MIKTKHVKKKKAVKQHVNLWPKNIYQNITHNPEALQYCQHKEANIATQKKGGGKHTCRPTTTFTNLLKTINSKTTPLQTWTFKRLEKGIRINHINDYTTTTYKTRVTTDFKEKKKQELQGTKK